MLRPRVIPVLQVSQGALVKTTRFAEPQYLGDPLNAVRILSDLDADELIVLDIGVAAHQGPDLALIELLASEAMMPLTYGGGIDSIRDAVTIVNMGVEKIAVQRRAFEDLAFLGELANTLGAQSVVFSIDIDDNELGREVRGMGHLQSHVNAADVVHAAVQSGAGEVLLTCVNREGTFQGPDLRLIQEHSAACSVPLIYQGGIRSLADVAAVLGSGADGVAVGALFCLYGPYRAPLISYPLAEEIAELVDKERQ